MANFIKIGDALVNKNQIMMIWYCSGNTIEAILLDGRTVYGIKDDVSCLIADRDG